MNGPAGLLLPPVLREAAECGDQPASVSGKVISQPPSISVSAVTKLPYSVQSASCAGETSKTYSSKLSLPFSAKKLRLPRHSSFSAPFSSQSWPWLSVSWMFSYST